MLVIFQVIFGIVFILLMFSLLATSLMELVSSWLSLRGRTLRDALRNMLADNLGDFMAHPLFQQLSYQPSRKGPFNWLVNLFGKNKPDLPSYLSADTFSAIVLDLLAGDDSTKLQERISALPDSPHKQLAEYLLRNSGHKIDHFQANLERYFNEVMDRATGWYKRITNQYLIGIGLAIAVVFNADTLNIYYHLSYDQDSREQVYQLAEEYLEKSGHLPPSALLPNTGDAAGNFREFMQTDFKRIQSPLGLGWSSVDFAGADYKFWMYKIVGWLVTAIAISLGAPFWFDMLKRLVNIRNSGKTADESTNGQITKHVEEILERISKLERKK